MIATSTGELWRLVLPANKTISIIRLNCWVVYRPCDLLTALVPCQVGLVTITLGQYQSQSPKFKCWHAMLLHITDGYNLTACFIFFLSFFDICVYQHDNSFWGFLVTGFTFFVLFFPKLTSSCLLLLGLWCSVFLSLPIIAYWLICTSNVWIWIYDCGTEIWAHKSGSDITSLTFNNFSPCLHLVFIQTSK